MYLNEVNIIGNLTRDPELKALPTGTQVANFSVATNRTWKDKDGGKQEAVEYHNLVAFGRTAEVIAQYIKKGDQILVKGRLQTRTWDKDGVKQYRTEIIVDTFQFGNKAGGGSKPADTRSQADKDFDNYGKDEQPAAPAEPSIEYPEEEINPEDIPF